MMRPGEAEGEGEGEGGRGPEQGAAAPGEASESERPLCVNVTSSCRIAVAGTLESETPLRWCGCVVV